ncbi:MAG: hypothetical protein V8Q27_01775 [Eubacteriales bacterium]
MAVKRITDRVRKLYRTLCAGFWKSITLHSFAAGLRLTLAFSLCLPLSGRAVRGFLGCMARHGLKTA